MAQYVVLINDEEQHVQTVKIGFSWVLLFWSWLFGLPFFIRRVYTLGALFAVLQVVNFFAQWKGRTKDCFYTFSNESSHMSVYSVSCDYASPSGLFFLILLTLSIYMGFRGNELTARYYLKRGYRFDSPESALVKVAKARWHMPLN